MLFLLLTQLHAADIPIKLVEHSAVRTNQGGSYGFPRAPGLHVVVSALNQCLLSRVQLV